MAHPLEATIRAAYSAFGRGDVDGYLQPCEQDFSFNIPGHGAIAGSWRGKEGLYELARIAMEVTGGTFREEVGDVLANDHHAVVLARHNSCPDAQSNESGQHTSTKFTTANWRNAGTTAGSVCVRRSLGQNSGALCEAMADYSDFGSSAMKSMSQNQGFLS